MAFRQNKGTSSGWMEYLKKHWYIILGIIIALPFVYKYLRNQLQSIADNQQSIIRDNPEMLDDALSGVTTNRAVQIAAKKVYECFNIPKSIWGWGNPNNWGENDQGAWDAIMSVSPGGVVPDVLIDCYFLTSGGNDLFNDCQKYLNDSYMEQLRF
jgi:hypothetical protein